MTIQTLLMGRYDPDFNVYMMYIFTATCRSNSTPPGFRHKKGQLGLRPTNQVTSPLSATYKIPASAMAQWNVTSTHQENYIGSLVPGHPFSKVVELDLTRNFLVGIVNTFQ